MADSEERKPRGVVIAVPKRPVSRLTPAERNKPPRTTKSAMTEHLSK